MPKRPSHILILAAMKLEIAPLIKRYPNDADLDFLVAGIGADRMAHRLKIYLDQAAHDISHDISHVLHVGVAGGLNPALRAGQVLRFGRVLRNDAPPLVLGDETHALLTTDHLAASPKAKQALFDQHHADAVDMETYDVAKLLMDRGIRFTAMRAISDAANTALPPESGQWVDEAGTPNPWAAMRYLACRPHKLPAMLQLQRAMQRATTQLAHETSSLIERLRDET